MIEAKEKDEILREIARPRKHGENLKFSPKSTLQKAIVEELRSDHMIEVDGGYSLCTITAKGRKFLDDGGYTVISTKKEAEESELKKLQREYLELINEKERYERKIRGQKTAIRWWQIATIAFAILSLIISR